MSAGFNSNTGVLKKYVKLIENNIYGQNQGRNVMKNIKVIRKVEN